MKKTTVELPQDLWKAVKQRALDEGSDMRAIILVALERYLSQPRGRRKG